MGNTPNIRFKGFTNDWEQRKLGEVFQEYSEKNHPELPALTIIQGGGTVLREESERKLQYDKSSLAGYKMVREDDFIVHLRSFEGGLEKSNHNGLISPAYHTFHGDEVDSRFYYPYFRSYEFIKHKLVPHVYGIRDGRSIDIDGMKTIEIPWTLYEEQKKIGDYIESLDTLITLHQRKCDETKKLKKFMLQKMFPKKDAKKPEIRFAGFTDDWEQRKLGDICSRVQGNDGRMELPTLTISAANGWMKQEDRFSGNIAGKEQTNYTLLHKGELSYNHGNSKLAKYGTVFSLQTYEEALVPRVYHSFKVENESADFIEYYFATKIPDRELRKLISSGARMDGLLNIGYDDFMGIKMMFPSASEQDKIAEYFRALDHIITLHQRKCDELKEFKKYMLQNMFPQKG